MYTKAYPILVQSVDTVAYSLAFTHTNKKKSLEMLGYLKNLIKMVNDVETSSGNAEPIMTTKPFMEMSASEIAEDVAENKMGKQLTEAQKLQYELNNVAEACNRLIDIFNDDETYIRNMKDKTLADRITDLIETVITPVSQKGIPEEVANILDNRIDLFLFFTEDQTLLSLAVNPIAYVASKELISAITLEITESANDEANTLLKNIPSFEKRLAQMNLLEENKVSEFIIRKKLECIDELASKIKAV